jgi:UDP-N-acetyl-2-amino-2-deoxyglucuronate dehydrogenase
MKPIGTALIGCGKVGDTHAQALKSLDESHFVAAYDIDPARAKAMGAKYDVPTYNNLQEMLDTSEVQMASICTPNHTHAELAIACAQAGVHALVEKPMTIDLKDCDRAIEAADRAGTTLGVICQRRLYEPVLRIKRAIVEGKIGNPILATLIVMGWRDAEYYRMDPWRGKWGTEGGGVLLTQTSHQLDLIQWFMGPIDELFGYWDNLNHPYIEVEDTAVAVMRFKNGALGVILVSNSQNPGLYGSIHIHGENGASIGVQTESGSPFISGVTETVDPPINDLWTVPGEEHLLAQWQEEDRARCERIDVMTHYHKLQIQDFLRAILEGREPLVTGREGRKHVEIFAAIYRSQFMHHPVKFPLDAERGSDHFDGRTPPLRS